MKSILTLLFITLVSVAYAQMQTFDIATFTPPSGWQREDVDFAASYVITNNKTGSWCRVTLYKSIGSSGDPAFDFDHEWKDLVAKERPDVTPPAKESVTEDGWTAISGAGKYLYQNKDAFILLTTVSGYGKEVSIVANMNSQEYISAVQAFLESIDLKKPDVPAVANQKPATAVVTSMVISETPSTNGISISTTNFDDGWVAQPFTDFVKVTKGPVTVRLHYPIKITDDLLYANDMQRLLFDKIILPRYNVTNLRKFDNGGPCYFCIYFFEADVVEKATGKSYHLGFRIITDSGISKCIEVTSPNAASFQKEFPNQEKIAAMLGYNKFAVSLKDIIGTWQASSGAAVQLYNTVTGGYAGMNASSSADTFTFNNDGTYSSNHKGAFGMVGSQTMYDQKYNGKFTLTNWELTATNRWQGKTDAFWVQFEAVRDGKIMHFTDKTASGIQYHLVKKTD